MAKASSEPHLSSCSKIPNPIMDGYDTVNGRGWEMVPAAARPTTTAISFSDELCVFPPSLHEGLTPTLTRTLDPSPSERFEEYKQEEENDQEVLAQLTSTRISKSAKRLVDLGVEFIRSKLSNVGGGGGCCGGAFWSFAAVAGLAGVLMFARGRHRPERELLLLLLLEKDQRIDQLTNQIVMLSEIVAANHKVPVLKNT